MIGTNRYLRSAPSLFATVGLDDKLTCHFTGIPYRIFVLALERIERHKLIIWGIFKLEYVFFCVSKNLVWIFRCIRMVWYDWSRLMVLIMHHLTMNIARKKLSLYHITITLSTCINTVRCWSSVWPHRAIVNLPQPSVMLVQCVAS